MKRFLITSLFVFVITYSFSQEMNNTKLDILFTSVSDTIQGEKGRWQFLIKDVMFICITDSTHNRMRIMSPIIEVKNLDENAKTLALMANYHTVLDVKYAISDDVLWSVFIHPLRELTIKQAEDAVSQVYFANKTFGTTFTSTSLVFPGSLTNKNEQPKNEEEFKKEKF